MRGQLETGHAARHIGSKGRHRRQYAAMRDSANYDDGRDRVRSGGSLKSSDHPSGSTRESRTSHDSHSRHHHSHHQSSTHNRRRSRDGSRDRHGHSPSESSRKRLEPVDDLIPRYRASKEQERDNMDAERRPARASGRDRGDSVPSSASKRPRSRSRSPSHERSHRKKSRRERSPSYRRGDADEDYDSRKKRRRSPHESRKSSPRSRSRRSNSHERDIMPRSKHRSRSRHSARDEIDSGHSTRESRQPKSTRHRHRSRTRSPRAGSRNLSPVPRRSRSRDRHGSSSSRQPRTEPRDAILDEQRPPPARSPARRNRYHDDSEERYSRRRLNSNDDMSRVGYRGEYPPSVPQSAYHDDGYRRSPKPHASFHDPPPEPAYASGRGWPSHRYSPQSHHSKPYTSSDRDYGHHAGSQSHYPPDSRPPPSGPQHPAASFRGGGRGNGFRGLFSGRGGGPESANGLPRSGAGFHDRGDEDWNNSRQPEDPPADMEQPLKETRTMAPPNRPPPTGPAAHNNSSSKFSFAFKASSKPAAAAPKPEISQKFNAMPRGSHQADAQDREPPKSAPTEPASARARHEGRIPEGPRMAPRMRKVKKMMKRPKARPTLSPELAASESVFYRKPGNESVVGSGTYGKVFKGLNVYTKGLVALKRIRMEGERDGFPVTAVREIKLLQSLRHLNIVMLQEVMVEKNDCFMVFEYMSHDLTGLLNHPSFKLDPAQKKHLAKQMFDGLDYLHTRGVLHRDIKAANILVSSDGILKIADFGLARFYAKHHRLDYTNRVITIWYRSPELLLGETQYTAAVDVWSAACVMIEIFTRGAIFPGDGTELNQLEKIYNVLGTPNRRDWPGLVDMAWFELLRPGIKKKSVFAEKYADKVTPAAFDLLEAMFLYDPAKRPTAAQVLQHAYFTVEEPLPKQAVELASIEGEWHEFESKALRKENERKAREARRAEAGGATSSAKDRDRKRAHETRDDSSQRDTKRTHIDGQEPTTTRHTAAEQHNKEAGAA